MVRSPGAKGAGTGARYTQCANTQARHGDGSGSTRDSLTPCRGDGPHQLPGTWHQEDFLLPFGFAPVTRERSLLSPLQDISPAQIELPKLHLRVFIFNAGYFFFFLHMEFICSFA